VRLLAAAPGSAGHLALAISRARQRLRSYLRGNALAQRARDHLGMLLRDL